ncbi:sulfurtransferase, partial [uncultured Clostridium sp.]|uniref:sulfurtransferase n=1 Tax=uncultured Clostridium sp. TaxID=59620 RepID=UPI00262094F1
MNNKVQKATIAIIAILIFLATFIGTNKEQVVVEAKKIVSDSNNINNAYLIGAESLETSLGGKNIVILDIRDNKQYKDGHIVGAINISWDNFIKNSSSNNYNNTGNQKLDKILDIKALTNELDRLGITKESEVVIYGNSNGDDMGQLGNFTKMFKLAGIKSKMLNGGFKNWEAEGFVTTVNIPLIKKSNLEIENLNGNKKTTKNSEDTKKNKKINKEYIKKHILKVKVVELINDVKEDTSPSNSLNSNPNNPSQKVVQGLNVKVKLTSEIAKLNPPIKGVIQINLSEILNPNGTIKPVSELQNLFTAKGIENDNIVLFYNTQVGNLNFLSSILNMAGYNKIYDVNMKLSDIEDIQAQIKAKTNEVSGVDNTSNT